jgi:dTMP kinase
MIIRRCERNCMITTAAREHSVGPGRVQAVVEGRERRVFIVFEGGDGAGKSYQAAALGEWMTQQGYDVVVTREPGGTHIGEAVRSIVLDPETKDLDDHAEALLYAAARAQHVAEVVLPALERGAVVISDRYVDSSLAYQGVGRPLDTDEVARVNAWATRNLKPDVTVLLDVPPTVGLARIGRGFDRLEQAGEEFHERVRDAYLALVAQDPDRYLVVDATGTPEDIQEEVRRRLNPKLSKAVTP